MSPSTSPAVPAAPTEPAVAGSRTLAKAFGDIRTGWLHRQLWGHVGWQDIKQRYRRSVLGPLWITVSMALPESAAAALTLVWGTGHPMAVDSATPVRMGEILAGALLAIAVRKGLLAGALVGVGQGAWAVGLRAAQAPLCGPWDWCRRA